MLFVYLFFTAPVEETTNNSFTTVEQEAAVVHEKDVAKDIQHQFEIISNDFKNRNCLTPRRNIQTTSAIPNPAKLLNTARSFQAFRLKEKEQLQKVNEFVTECQTLNYSSLLACRGYHVYALRKIII